MAGGDMGGLAALLGGGGGGFGGLGGGVPPVADPETTYASQLTQLQVGSSVNYSFSHAMYMFLLPGSGTCIAE